MRISRAFLAARVQTDMTWRSGALKRVCAAHVKRRRATTIDAGTGLEITEDNEPGAAPGPARGAGQVRLQPRQCPRFLQRQVAAAFPAICDGLLEKAKSGDVACAKALWQMAEFDQKPSKARGRRPANTGLAFARKVLAEFEAQ